MLPLGGTHGVELPHPTPPSGVAWTDFTRLVRADRIVRIVSEDKDDALRELVDAVVRSCHLVELERRELLDSVRARERELNTQIAPGWAVPHGRVASLEEPVLVIGRAPEGLIFGPVDMGPVHLLFLFASSAGTHVAYLRALAGLARSLHECGLSDLRRAALADTPGALLGALQPTRGLRRPSRRLLPATRAVVRHALALANEVAEGGTMLFADALRAPLVLSSVVTRKTILVTRSAALPEALGAKARGVIALPHGCYGEESAVQFALLAAAARGLLSAARVVAVYGERGSDALDTIRIETPQQLVERVYGPEGEVVAPDVLERALQLVVEIAEEGREGHAVGSTMILGDTENVRPLTRQLTINPFRGYKEHERSILDPTLEQTIKEFAMLDGAFVIDDRGVIESAGTYLSAPSLDIDLDSGLGTRHRAAAGISRATKAIAVVLSQSGGRVSVYRGGVEVMRITPPRPRGAVSVPP